MNYNLVMAGKVRLCWLRGRVPGTESGSVEEQFFDVILAVVENVVVLPLWQTVTMLSSNTDDGDAAACMKYIVSWMNFEFPASTAVASEEIIVQVSTIKIL